MPCTDIHGCSSSSLSVRVEKRSQFFTEDVHVAYVVRQCRLSLFQCSESSCDKFGMQSPCTFDAVDSGSDNSPLSCPVTDVGSNDDNIFDGNDTVVDSGMISYCVVTSNACEALEKLLCVLQASLKAQLSRVDKLSVLDLEGNCFSLQ